MVRLLLLVPQALRMLLDACEEGEGREEGTEAVAKKLPSLRLLSVSGDASNPSP